MHRCCSDGESPDDGQEAQDPSQELADYLVALKLQGKPASEDVCVICFLAQSAGMRGAATALARKPGDQSTNHYQRHLDKVLGVEACLGDQEYQLEVPGSDKYAFGRFPVELPALCPHEVLGAEVEQDGGALSQLKTEAASLEWGQAFAQHPVKQAAQPGEVVWPVALYCDGLPYQKRE